MQVQVFPNQFSKVQSQNRGIRHTHLHLGKGILSSLTTTFSRNNGVSLQSYITRYMLTAVVRNVLGCSIVKRHSWHYQDWHRQPHHCKCLTVITLDVVSNYSSPNGLSRYLLPLVDKVRLAGLPFVLTLHGALWKRWGRGEFNGEDLSASYGCRNRPCTLWHTPKVTSLLLARGAHWCCFSSSCPSQFL